MKVMMDDPDKFCCPHCGYAKIRVDATETMDAHYYPPSKDRKQGAEAYEIDRIVSYTRICCAGCDSDIDAPKWLRDLVSRDAVGCKAYEHVEFRLNDGEPQILKTEYRRVRGRSDGE